MKEDEHIVLFDGVCNLCNGAVRFILARDPRERFRFASLQSDVARRLLKGDGPPETIVLIEAGKIYTKSTAALRIARGLSGSAPGPELATSPPTYFRKPS